MGLAELVSRLEHDADARVAAIRAGAAAEVERLRVEGASFAARAREDALAAMREQRRTRLAREMAEVRRRARIEELRAAHALVDRVMARVGELIPDVESDRAYLAAMPERIEDALRYVPQAGGAVIRCRPALAPVVRSAIAGREGLRCEEVPDMSVGFTIAAHDGSVDVDVTLSGRLTRLRRWLGTTIAGQVAP